MLSLIFVFLVLKPALILCSLTDPVCFFRIKDKENLEGDKDIDCSFFIYTENGSMKNDYFSGNLDKQMTSKNVHLIFSLYFAMEEINRNPHILPNISLLANIKCNLMEKKKKYGLSPKRSENFPNYYCKNQRKYLIVLTGPTWGGTATFGPFQYMSRTPELYYGYFQPFLNVHEQFPHLYQISPTDTSLPLAMVSLLVHFRWNWVGVIISDEDRGIHFLSELREEMQRNIVCLAFVSIIIHGNLSFLKMAEKYFNQIMMSSARVVIVYGDKDSTVQLNFILRKSVTFNRIWVSMSQFDRITIKGEFLLNSPHGTLIYSHHISEISGFKQFIQRVHPSNYSNEISLVRLWWIYFNCSLSSSNCKKLKNCSTTNIFKWLFAPFGMSMSDSSYNLYNAVYAVAHSLHEMLLKQVDIWPENAGNRLELDSWKIPPSVCSRPCSLGHRKSPQEGKAICCFDCNPCPENKISNMTNMDDCVKCPDDQYSNAKRTHCLKKVLTFLAYEDPLGMCLAGLALCFSSLTAAVLAIFLKHQDTPTIKANNRVLSYVLLISLIFCFLCPLLYIGHPNMATCILQQTAFAIVFTVAASSVLAKTITVVLAFKVTVPDRRMRWFLTSGAPNFIIPICTVIQLIICGIWMGTSPPFVDEDVHAKHGHILIVCNKGSVIAFHCVLGYLVSLALASFTVAFLARNLPDTFNEAKFLTFSMLVFCSVWITFLPVYQSTKGKATVTVEIFCILASSAGLLFCIFAPKCYIILFKPQKNSFHKITKTHSKLAIIH
uniref:Vomeronasal type-2 receptor 116-like n=1 Tax=Peromyscus maniculatus bairdii TaxID=230844 RepID=A0A8C8U086_PERMB